MELRPLPLLGSPLIPMAVVNSQSTFGGCFVCMFLCMRERKLAYLVLLIMNILAYS